MELFCRELSISLFLANLQQINQVNFSWLISSSARSRLTVIFIAFIDRNKYASDVEMMESQHLTITYGV